MASPGLYQRDNCAACNPGDAKSTAVPLIRTADLEKLYETLLASVKGIQFSQRELGQDTIQQRRTQTAPICCKLHPHSTHHFTAAFFPRYLRALVSRLVLSDLLFDAAGFIVIDINCRDQTND